MEPSMAHTIRPRREAQREVRRRGRGHEDQSTGVISFRRDPRKPRPRLEPVIRVTDPIRFEDLVPERADPDANEE